MEQQTRIMARVLWGIALGIIGFFLGGFFGTVAFAFVLVADVLKAKALIGGVAVIGALLFFAVAFFLARYRPHLKIAPPIMLIVLELLIALVLVKG